jgi:hypothetical protein
VAHLTTYNRLIREFDLADEKVGMCYALEGKARTLYGMDDAEYAFVFAQEALSEIKKSDLLFPLHSILDINISCAYKLESIKMPRGILKSSEILNVKH